MPKKMTAAEIILAALIWGDESMSQMVEGLHDGDPYKDDVKNQLKQLRAYRRRRFGEIKDPTDDCKLVSALEFNRTT